MFTKKALVNPKHKDMLLSIKKKKTFRAVSSPSQLIVKPQPIKTKKKEQTASTTNKRKTVVHSRQLMITEKIQQTRLIASGYAEREISQGKLHGKRQTHSPPLEKKLCRGGAQIFVFACS